MEKVFRSSLVLLWYFSMVVIVVDVLGIVIDDGVFMASEVGN